MIMSNTRNYAIGIAVIIIIGVAGYYLWTTSQQPPEELLDIVDTAVEAGSFTTLVTAVQAADLVDALKGEGPFTVFAPTDDAFDALPEGVLEGLLANTTALADVLTYHVVVGEYMAADVVAMDSLTTLQGSDLMIDTTDGVMIDGAQVVQTDIECSNGVIHVIDAVMIPGE